MMRPFLLSILISIAPSVVTMARPTPQSSAIAYQGQLKFNGQPATATYDFECRLFDALSGGNPVGSLLTPGSIEADDDGRFTMTLDFGALAFDGSERWLQLGVRVSGGGPAFTPLSPRQKIESSPYAAFALRSGLSGTYTDAVTLNNPGNAITGAFSGSGAGISNLNAGAIGGIINSANISGSYSNAVTLNNAGNAFTGSGAGLTALNASNVTGGSLDAARLPSGGGWSLASALNLDGGTLVIDAAGNRVGIGTATPATSSKLHIFRGSSGVTAQSSGTTLLLENSQENYLTLRSPEGVLQGITFSQPSGVSTAYMLLNNGFNTGALSLGTAGQERMVILPGGNVGVGTTAPGTPLHVVGGLPLSLNAGDVAGGSLMIGATTALRFGPNQIQQQGASGVPGSLSINPLGGSVEIGNPSNSSVNINSTIFSVDGSASFASGASFNEPVRALESVLVHSGVFEVARLDKTGEDGYLELRDQSNTPSVIISSDNVNSAGEIAMYAAEGGARTVQVLSDEADTAPRIRLNTAASANTVELDGLETSSSLAGGALRLNNSSGALTIHLQGGPGHINCVSLTQTSTRDAKHNVQPLTGALDIVRQLQGVRFNWNESYGGKGDIGFIAEDVASVLPEVVAMREDGPGALGMDYGHVVAVTVEAIKAMDQRLAEKDAQIAALHDELAALRGMVQELLDKAGGPVAGGHP